MYLFIASDRSYAPHSTLSLDAFDASPTARVCRGAAPPSHAVVRPAYEWDRGRASNVRKALCHSVRPLCRLSRPRDASTRRARAFRLAACALTQTVPVDAFARPTSRRARRSRCRPRRECEHA